MSGVNVRIKRTTQEETVFVRYARAECQRCDWTSADVREEHVHMVYGAWEEHFAKRHHWLGHHGGGPVPEPRP